mgnify:CR=1 FL=1
MRKKQIILPLIILIAGIGAFAIFTGMKKPPEEKEEVDNTPIVSVESITVAPMTLNVDSYGIVKPKYETDLVAQVNGEIIELADVFVRGGFVKKDQVLARIDPSDYQAALIDAQASLASARASLETEVAQGKVAEREWNQITDTSPTELSLRKPQLAQELARVKAAQASILRAERNLERTNIVAPYDAMIESRDIGLGAFVGMGNKIGKILSTELAEVRLPVADNQLQYLIDQGENAKVILHGVYSGKEIQWPAKIVRDEGVIDNQSRMSYLVAEVHDPYALNTSNNQPPLRYGSYVNAKIVGIEIAQASVIPRYLVNNSKVAILDSESRLHYAEVHIARQDGENIIVSNGLEDNDQLIVSALDYPVDGMKLALISDKQEESEQESDDETQVALNDNDTGE